MRPRSRSRAIPRRGWSQKMPGSEDFIQGAVHALEAGGLAVWIRRGLALVAIIALAVIYFYGFRGLATSQAMDQAQIGREIASGHGWRTNFARPRAVGQLQAHGKEIARKIWFDTYNAPLPPLVDAIALRPVKAHWTMTPSELVYTGDKAIVIMSMLLFIGSVVVLFFIARRLFDQRLALLACSLVLLCDAVWQYSLSGLPQMLLLFLFNSTVYALVRAVEARYGGGRVGLWLVFVGAGFGLLALTHALTIWIFLGALIFCVFFFRPRGWAAAIILAVFLIFYLPWLFRNYLICGNPAGVAIYSVLDGFGHSEAVNKPRLSTRPHPGISWVEHCRARVFRVVATQLQAPGDRRDSLDDSCDVGGRGAWHGALRHSRRARRGREPIASHFHATDDLLRPRLPSCAMESARHRSSPGQNRFYYRAFFALRIPDD